MPVASAVHRRTLPLCESLSIREWAGYYAVDSYESRHEHEYSAIRHGAALIDVSPLYKYVITGKDATRFVDYVITRDVSKMAVGQVFYTLWCDGAGKVIDDGTVSRLGEERYRWTAADPNLRWFHQSARGFNVTIKDVTSEVAALALQGPMAAEVLRKASDIDVDGLSYFRVTSGTVAGVQVDVSRTGYTGDLGYEVWMRWRDAVKVWDALVERGEPFALRPTGMLALDMARIEAGLLLTDVDFVSSRKARIASQRYSPLELGLGRLVSREKAPFIGQRALEVERHDGPSRAIVGLEFDWNEIEDLFERVGLPPEVPRWASRIAVPVFKGNTQVGKATSTTWSPTLKKLIGLSTVEREFTPVGTQLRVEFTIEAVRHKVEATVVETPFFNPPRKTALPPP